MFKLNKRKSVKITIKTQPSSTDHKIKTFRLPALQKIDKRNKN